MQYIKRTSIILTIALIPSLGVALDPTTSGRIIDNFKEQQESILFESLPFSESGANMILEHEYAMNGLDGLRARLSLVQGAYIAKKSAIVPSLRVRHRSHSQPCVYVKKISNPKNSHNSR